MDGVHGAQTVTGLVAPTPEQIEEYAARQRVAISLDDVDKHVDRVAAWLTVFDRLDRIEQPQVPLRYPLRDPGRPPGRHEDPHNAVIRWCDVKGAKTGRLAGRRIAVKDTIAVAGVPMTAGLKRVPAVIPTEDAVTIERLLDAGATIVAKTNVGIADEAEFGATRNPRDPRYSSGGSSSGSAAVVAAGIVDGALGADQGGSVRIPAAWCGIVGMKATHGAVPSYGLIHWDHTLDHIGPMTTTVADNAAMLEVIAGGDWRNPESDHNSLGPGDFTSAARLGIKGLRVGVVGESLEPSGCSPATLSAFDRAVKTLRHLGADVVPVSVPLWTEATTIWLAVLTFGLTATANAFGRCYGQQGRVDIDLLATAATQQLQGVWTMPFGGRTLPLAFEHLRDAYRGAHFGRAQNLRLRLRQQVDAALADADLILTPTTITGPFELDQKPQRVSKKQQNRVMSLSANTCQLNLTGHPALTVPAGPGDNEFPIGLQIIGRRFDEHTVYRAGFAFESATQSR